MRIGIAGAGGIGSNVALALVRAGIRQFKIVDFDCIEMSNLNRQFYFADQIGQPKAETLAENLMRITPDIDVQTQHLRLNADNIGGVFANSDVLVEGFDGAPDKKMLIETFAGTSKLVVSASGIAGIEIDAIGIKKVGNCHIVGDFASVAGNDNLYAPKVIMVASIMSQIVLKHCFTGVFK